MDTHISPVRLKSELDFVRQLLGDDIPSASFLAKYQPSKEWFIHEPQGIHGVGHASRVLILGEILGTLVQKKGTLLDKEAIRWAAITHDTQRIDDGVDPEHGTRSSEWVKKFLTGTRAPLDTVAYLNRWHTPSDYQCQKMTAELKVLKDADALDRWRIGDFDQTYLRTAEASFLVNIAYALFELSSKFEKEYDQFSAALKSAQQLQLVK